MLNHILFLFFALMPCGATSFLRVITPPPHLGTAVRRITQSAFPDSQKHKYLAGSQLESAFPDSQKHKYLGGSQLQSGDIYAVPSHSSNVLKISPTSSAATLLAPSPAFPTLKFKWLRAVNVHDKFVIGLPCWADSVLKIDTATDLVTTFGESFFSSLPHKPSSLRWNWHGGQLSSKNGFIYAVPANAPHVLKVHPHYETCSLVGPELPGSTKYYGGILDNSDNIYCVPYKNTRVLKISPEEDGGETVSEIGGEYTSLSDEMTVNYSWHGGVHCPDNDCIYAFPSHAASVLKIDCSSDETRLIGELRNSEYKWLGGTIDRLNNVWGVPSDATTILKIFTGTDEVVEVESDVIDKKKNKFQGAVAVGDYIFGIPSNEGFILRVNILTDEVTKIEGLRLPNTKDKFQGAFEREGKIWFVPECYPCPISVDLETLEIMEMIV